MSKGFCEHNVRYKHGESFDLVSLIKCSTCGRSTCLTCLKELQREVSEVCESKRQSGFELDESEQLLSLLNGDLFGNLDGTSVVAKTIGSCIWCPDRTDPPPTECVDPRALSEELGIDFSATYKKAKPCLSDEHERCVL